MTAPKMVGVAGGGRMGELGERFVPPRLLRDQRTRGEIGRTGQGFFSWEAS